MITQNNKTKGFATGTFANRCQITALQLPDLDPRLTYSVHNGTDTIPTAYYIGIVSIDGAECYQFRYKDCDRTFRIAAASLQAKFCTIQPDGIATPGANILEAYLDGLSFTVAIKSDRDVIAVLEYLRNLLYCDWLARKSGGQYYAKGYISTPIGDKQGKVTISYSLPNDTEGTKANRGFLSVELLGKALGTLTIGQQLELIKYIESQGYKGTRIDPKVRVYGDTARPEQIYDEVDNKAIKHIGRPKQYTRFGDCKFITEGGSSTFYLGKPGNIVLCIYDAYKKHKVFATDWECRYYKHHAQGLITRLAKCKNAEEFRQTIAAHVFGICNFINATGEHDGHAERYPIRDWQQSLRDKVTVACMRFRPVKREDVIKPTANWFRGFGKLLAMLGLYDNDYTGKELMAVLVDANTIDKRKLLYERILGQLTDSINRLIGETLKEGLDQLVYDSNNKYLKTLTCEVQRIRTAGMVPNLHTR